MAACVGFWNGVWHFSATLLWRAHQQAMGAVCDLQTPFQLAAALASAPKLDIPSLLLGRVFGRLQGSSSCSPVCTQAAATQQSVALFYAAPSMQAAAYVSDWDTWRANGVRFRSDLARN